MLKASNITKEYKISKKWQHFSKKSEMKTVLKNVSIEISKGKIVGLLGINGAGKTTTIKILSTMLEPTSGSVTIDGININKNKKKVKEKVNIIIGGERNLYWRLTARENLVYFGSLYGIQSKLLKDRIDNILKIVDLHDAADLPVEKYSKGMKQRLQIARGLINDPEYIFLDEPTLGLDVLISNDVRQYIKKLAIEENKGVMITSHYMKEMEELCDYVYLLENGKVVFEGTIKELKNKFGNKSKLIIQYIKYPKKIRNIAKKLNFECIENLEENELCFISDFKKINLLIKEFAFLEGDNLFKVEVSELSLEEILVTKWEEM